VFPRCLDPDQWKIVTARRLGRVAAADPDGAPVTIHDTVPRVVRGTVS
jgi:hypothetical protein